ncbi:MAG: histone deacetylase family protein [Oleispira antarctica]|uniref:Histone deacetylase superfamily protein n=1 Tax=Oleispira antarctica RB-8 TaxID=698738 RepID=R4YS35_OLEAN|nr:histone deacetylase family protein [Oleispira antarctica]MBQ0793608.1 histone deacetylase family protein [Oleispira antarctica]CCK76058.1 Histone deacetylase superfamily protein [Oleispira antarctica RB-8]
MKLGYYSYTSHLDHDVGDMHPEHPMRIIAINHQLERLGILQDAYRGGCNHVSQQDLLRAHKQGYVEQLLVMSPANGSILASVDTPMAVGSLGAAYQAAGCVVEALDDLLQDKVERAFCAVRPPGHHAERNKSMGFCFLNNVAIAAKKAQQQYGLERIAVIDFDVHQGNGTIDILANDPAFLICSSFQHPSFPFSHWRNIYSNVINTPLNEYSNGLEMRRAVEAQWLKQLQDFKPQLTIISAGFDAHTDDPMAELNWTEDDYAWLGGFLSEINKEGSSNKILAVLEGGYNLDALAASCSEFIIAFKE